MTARELAAALLALPEEQQDLEVFSTADWSTVTYVRYLGGEHAPHGRPVVEIS